MKPIINLYLYSSLHIAICAIAFTAASYILIGIEIDWNYCLFVASGTCVIYSLHRIVGIQKVSDSIIDNRFEVIRKYRSHMIIYAIIAAVVGLYTFWNISFSVKVKLIIPCVLSLLYVLPLFLKSQRLRDFDYIKIILVGICWALLCGLIPLLGNDISYTSLSLFTLEKFFFIIAITLPFDYRDTKVDKVSGVKTFAHLLGDKILYAILVCFLICIAFVLINPMYNLKTKILLIVIYFILDAITRFASKSESDYYFSGLIDGTMIIFGLWVYFGMEFFT